MKDSFIYHRIDSARILMFGLLYAVFVSFIACGAHGTAADVDERSLELNEIQRLIVVTDEVSVEVIPGSGLPLNLIKSIAMTPSDIRLRMGERARVSVQVLGKFGDMVEDLEYRWALVDPASGSFDISSDDGSSIEFTAGTHVTRFPGALALTIIQVYGEASYQIGKTISVTVEPREEIQSLVSVESLGGPIIGSADQLVRLQGIAYDALGRVVSQALLKWEISESDLGEILGASILRIDASFGIYPGALRLTGKLGDVSVDTTIDLQVLERDVLDDRIRVFLFPRSVRLLPGQTTEFGAVVIDGSGQFVNTIAQEWSLANPNAGKISGDGDFEAGIEEGVFRNVVIFSAERDGERVEARATVEIRSDTARPLSSVLVRPGRVALVPGQINVFTASAQDSFGRSLSDVDVNWSLIDPSVGRIDETGTFVTGIKVGTYEDVIEVTVVRHSGDVQESMKATASLTIIGELAEVVIEPDGIKIATDAISRFVGRPFDDVGNAVPGILLEWSMADPRAGQIDLSGVYTPGNIPGLYKEAIKVKAIQIIVPTKGE